MHIFVVVLTTHYVLTCPPLLSYYSRTIERSGCHWSRSALAIVSGRVLESAVFESVSTCDCNAYFCCCSYHSLCPYLSYYSRTIERSGCHWSRSALAIVSGRVLEFAVFESVSTCDCNAYFCCCSYNSLCPYLSASIVLLQSHDREKRLLPLYTHRLEYEVE
jgi:hypothetical protein